MINFYAPDFVNNAPLYCFLSDLMTHFPEWFYEDAHLSAAYGCFPNCIWNGGRVALGGCTRNDMDKIVEEYNNRGMAVRFTFTNPLITEEHLNDIYANICVQAANNGKNEIIINSEILEKYLREKYPNFRYISSTTKCLDQDKLLGEEMKKDYYLVVLDSALNNTETMMNIENKDKIELIADHSCQDNCPRRKAHYNAIGKAQLTFSKLVWPPCNNVGRSFYQYMENRSFITTEMIYGKYKEAGFKHYKLDGRIFTPSKLVESMVYYLVKPEHKDRVRQIILKEIYHM